MKYKLRLFVEKNPSSANFYIFKIKFMIFYLMGNTNNINYQLHIDFGDYWNLVPVQYNTLRAINLYIKLKKKIKIVPKNDYLANRLISYIDIDTLKNILKDIEWITHTNLDYL